jgi:predicted dithiol-disulfide oxidoreductase (DUF899 family)
MKIESSDLPPVVDRTAFQAKLDDLRLREKAHTTEGDAIAAARRRLPMVEVAADQVVDGPNGQVTLLDAFEGRRQLIAYYFMWNPGQPAPEQCEGCTWVTTNYRGVEVMDYSYALIDLTVFGRQEPWEDSPAGWTQNPRLEGSNRIRTNGRPTAQWSRLEAGRSDDLGSGR